MLRFAFVLMVAFALPCTATAQTALSDVDANGVYTLDEITAAYPQLTKDAYHAADANADGAIDAEELARAQKLGVIAG